MSKSPCQIDALTFFTEFRLKVRSIYCTLSSNFNIGLDYPRNVFTFSGGLTDQHQKPTITIVLYLERRESDPPSEYVIQNRGIGYPPIHLSGHKAVGLYRPYPCWRIKGSLRRY